MTEPAQWTVDDDDDLVYDPNARPDGDYDSYICRGADSTGVCITPAGHDALVQCVRDADRLRHLNAYSLARMFHEAYERLAPEFNYQTRKASAVPWDDVPEHNKALMIATARAVLDELAAEEPDQTDGGTDG